MSISLARAEPPEGLLGFLPGCIQGGQGKLCRLADVNIPAADQPREGLGQAARATDRIGDGDSIGAVERQVGVVGNSTLGGYGLYYVCLTRSGAVRTTSLIYITPGLTLVWAWAMFGQPMSPYTWVGLLLCLVGVYLARGERVPALSTE